MERGKGVNVWTEEGEGLSFHRRLGGYLSRPLTSVIVEALKGTERKIMQNPNSGLTYSPARARLLSL